MYKVIFDREAIEFLEKAEKKIAKRIYEKIISTKSNPHHFWERLKGRKDFKLRIGDYRAIADIDNNSETIQVTRIGHRKNIYKNLWCQKSIEHNDLLCSSSLQPDIERAESWKTKRFMLECQKSRISEHTKNQ